MSRAKALSHVLVRPLGFTAAEKTHRRADIIQSSLFRSLSFTCPCLYPAKLESTGNSVRAPRAGSWSQQLSRPRVALTVSTTSIQSAQPPNIHGAARLDLRTKFKWSFACKGSAPRTKWGSMRLHHGRRCSCSSIKLYSSDTWKTCIALREQELANRTH